MAIGINSCHTDKDHTLIEQSPLANIATSGYRTKGEVDESEWIRQSVTNFQSGPNGTPFHPHVSIEVN